MEFRITVTPQGVNVAGPIEDERLAMRVLAAAMQAVAGYHDRKAQQPGVQEHKASELRIIEGR